MLTRTRPASAAASSSPVIAARVPALDGRRGQRQILSHRPAPGRAVPVQVLEGYQERVIAFGGGQHPALQRGDRRPLGVWGTDALVDHRRALRRVSGGSDR